MTIEFPNRHTINPETGGMNFIAIVDKQDIVCQVSSEALQDINPAKRNDPIELQFKDNKSKIQSIARQKIQNGESKIFISSNDVHSL